MKKTVFFGMLAAAFAVVFAFTACLGDDDENKTKNMSDHEKRLALGNIAGNYKGKLHFYNPRHLDKRDSLTCDWNLSTYGEFSTNNLPVAFLANYVLEGSKVQEALDKAAARPFLATLSPQQKQSGEGVSMLMCTFLPQSYTLSFTTEYEDVQYNVSLNLLSSLSRQETSGSANYAAISEHVEYNTNVGRLQRMSAFLLLDKMTVNDQTYPINDYARLVGTKY